MASTPSFDPNLFVRGIFDEGLQRSSREHVQAFVQQGGSGSVSAGIDLQDADRSGRDARRRDWTGRAGFAPAICHSVGRRFHCWKRGGHGWMNLDDAITQSCDVYFYEAALSDRPAIWHRQWGREDCRDRAGIWSWANAMICRLSAIRGGILPSPKWKAQVQGRTLEPGRDVEHRDRAGRCSGFALATGGDGGADRKRAGGEAASGEICRRDRGADCRGRAFERAVDGMLRAIRQGDVERLERQSGYGAAIADRGRRFGDGRKDRHQPGPEHHSRRAGARCDAERSTAMGAAGSRAVRGLSRLMTSRNTQSRRLSNTGAAGLRRRPLRRGIFCLYALYGDVPPLEAYPLGPASASGFARGNDAEARG